MSTFSESNVVREKAGQPTGGQFAEKQRPASGISLSCPQAHFSQVEAEHDTLAAKVATVEDLAPRVGDTPTTAQQAFAEAWAEGHRTGWEHCQDGNYGNDYWDDPTPNPYAADRPSVTDNARAEAWAEGHRTGWEHCQDGNYGNDHWDDPTPNPYAAAARTETTTATIEDAEEVLHSAGWFARADLDPRDLRGILRDLADAGLLRGGSDG